MTFKEIMIIFHFILAMMNTAMAFHHISILTAIHVGIIIFCLVAILDAATDSDLRF